ncbi:MAG: acetyl-coenzyme A synthetase N-terminal domain-containing protein, partial [Oceanibaculum sp.]
MSDASVIPIREDRAKSAWIDEKGYFDLYERSIKDPDGFWAEHGKRIDWIKPYSKVKDISFDRNNLHIRWFEDGTLNVAANCIDRHLARRRDQVA